MHIHKAQATHWQGAVRYTSMDEKEKLEKEKKKKKFTAANEEE